MSPDTSLCGVSKAWYLAAKLGCAETKVATWDDLAFKLITLRLVQPRLENDPGRLVAAPELLTSVSINPLGKFDGKADERIFVGYSVSSKAFRVFNSRTIIVQETLHINFLENQPNVAGSGLTWLFDIDTLTQSMNYQPLIVGNQPISSAGIQENLNAGTVGKVAELVQQYVLLPLWSFGSKNPQNTDNAAFEVKEPESVVCVSLSRVKDLSDDFKEFSNNSTNEVNAASTPVTAVGPNSINSTNTFSVAGPSNNVVSLNFELGGKPLYVDPSQYPNDLDMPTLEDITYSDDEEDVGT
nr:ribonuclease H-like domain-containing protein [Tanacetum cinerariifolium]